MFLVGHSRNDTVSKWRAVKSLQYQSRPNYANKKGFCEVRLLNPKSENECPDSWPDPPPDTVQPIIENSFYKIACFGVAAYVECGSESICDEDHSHRERCSAII